MSEPRTSVGRDDPSAAFRLPYAVEPIRYDLRLVPDLEAATFSGEVRIEGIAHETVGLIVLHAAELTVQTAAVTSGQKAVAVASHSFDEVSERLTLELAEPVAVGPLSITITFAGILNDKLHGFYRSTYVDDSGTTHTLATTQFEATDARRAFPCFDEPDRKAVFSVTLDIPDHLAAVSNGPIVETTPLGNGRQRVRFGDTIPMSTYLVAFVIGRLEATDPVDAGGVPIRVVHVPGKEHLTAFALEVAAHSLAFFTDWFSIPYPAEKLDLVAIPDFAFGAMENLGCVTFRETALLAHPEQASRVELERIADVVSHEIAHMWFGDLVTMRWWNGIWLNEAFATLMELLCVDAFRPEWHRWISFGMEREVAMATDSLHTTRPVEYPVGPPEEAQGMFDVLTYQKGASVLRMLERYLGPERFREGIRRYLSDHRLGNTDTSDLWDAIEAASGEPVRTIMDSWILQGGFPLVHAQPDEDGLGLVLTQTPFAYATAGADPSAIGAHWQIPILTRQLTDAAGDEDEVARTLLAEVPAHVASAAGQPPLVVNAGSAGFYRVRYAVDHLNRLAEAWSSLAPLERFNLLGDTWAAVVGDQATLAELLPLMEAVRAGEDDPDVWTQVVLVLSFLDRSLPEDDCDLVGSYARLLLRPAFDRLGWEPAPGEAQRTRTLRSLLVGSLGTFGRDVEVRERCARLYRQASGGGPPLDPDLAGSIVTTIAAAGGSAEFKNFLDRYRHPATPQEEVRYLHALAGFDDPALGERAFVLAMTEVRTQNAPSVIQLLLANRSAGEATWHRVAERWDEVVAKFPANILPRMLDSVKALCRDPSLTEEIRQFITAHPIPIGQRTVNQAVERLGVNTALTLRLSGEATVALTAGQARLGT